MKSSPKGFATLCLLLLLGASLSSFSRISSFSIGCSENSTGAVSLGVISIYSQKIVSTCISGIFNY
jgi:hypothetical protein